MNILQNLISLIKNKYVVLIIAFLVWLVFFDSNSLINQHRLNKELAKVQKEKQFYIAEINRDKKTAYNLMSDEDNLEKFAREEYLMKRDNEDIFIIINESKAEKALRLKEAAN